MCRPRERLWKTIHATVRSFFSDRCRWLCRLFLTFYVIIFSYQNYIKTNCSETLSSEDLPYLFINSYFWYQRSNKTYSIKYSLDLQTEPKEKRKTVDRKMKIWIFSIGFLNKITSMQAVIEKVWSSPLQSLNIAKPDQHHGCGRRKA